MEVRRTMACLIVLAAVFFTGFISSQPDETASYENCVAVKKFTALLRPDSANHPEQYPADHSNSPDCRPPKWYAVFKRIEGWQFVIAVIGIGVIAWQSIATARSAKAAQRSIELQEIGLRQWVDVQNWRATPYQPEGGTVGLSVQFDVVNPTPWPITLSGAFIVFADQPNSVKDRRNLLSPTKLFPIVFQIKITDEQLTKWE